MSGAPRQSPHAPHPPWVWITPYIAQGRLVSGEQALALRAAGVTHVLNVGEAPNQLEASRDGFREVVWHPLEDVLRISDNDAISCIETLHRMLHQPGSRVYIHCVAGQNRSPTVLWLYLIACGLDPQDAQQLIEARNPDAIPGHSRLADDYLVRLVKWHGATQFQPLERPEIITPAD